jgi:hypothetical protein
MIMDDQQICEMLNLYQYEGRINWKIKKPSQLSSSKSNTGNNTCINKFISSNYYL